MNQVKIVICNSRFNDKRLNLATSTSAIKTTTISNFANGIFGINYNISIISNISSISTSTIITWPRPPLCHHLHLLTHPHLQSLELQRGWPPRSTKQYEISFLKSFVSSDQMIITPDSWKWGLEHRSVRTWCYERLTDSCEWGWYVWPARPGVTIVSRHTSYVDAYPYILRMRCQSFISTEYIRNICSIISQSDNRMHPRKSVPLPKPISPP